MAEEQVIEPNITLNIGDAPAAPASNIAGTPPEVQQVPVVEEAVAYEPTGDVGLDMALDFIGKAGISVEHPAMKAAQAGDFALLKATLAQKGIQGWEQFVALGEAAYTKVTAEQAAKEKASREAIIKEAGGEVEWQAIQKWAGANATPEEKAQINKMLGEGGVAAKSAIKYLVDVYNKANNVVKEPLNPLANAGANAPSSNGPLSSSEYVKEVAALNRKLGGRMEDSKEYSTLQQRRLASR
jgi:hypothetical protein